MNKIDDIIFELYNRGILNKKEFITLSKSGDYAKIKDLKSFLTTYVSSLKKDNYPDDYCNYFYNIINKLDVLSNETEKPKRANFKVLRLNKKLFK